MTNKITIKEITDLIKNGRITEAEDVKSLVEKLEPPFYGKDYRIFYNTITINDKFSDQDKENIFQALDSLEVSTKENSPEENSEEDKTLSEKPITSNFDRYFENYTNEETTKSTQNSKIKPDKGSFVSQNLSADNIKTSNFDNKFKILTEVNFTNKNKTSIKSHLNKINTNIDDKVVDLANKHFEVLNDQKVDFFHHLKDDEVVDLANRIFEEIKAIKDDEVVDLVDKHFEVLNDQKVDFFEKIIMALDSENFYLKSEIFENEINFSFPDIKLFSDVE